MHPIMMTLFNPRGDGTLVPGDLMYDIMHGRDLVTLTHDGTQWVETGREEISAYVGSTG